jgi:hypothetical protein
VPITRRRFLTTAAGAAAGLAVGGPTLWVPPARAATPPAGLHLGFGPDPRTAMNLSWSTAESVRKPFVDIGLDTTYGKRVFADGNGAPGVGNHFHHASVGKLDAGTTYHYRVTHDGGPELTGTFTTAPAAPEPFRFATFGDMGVSAGAAANVATLAAQSPDLCFVVGDLCYADLSGGTDQLTVLPYDPAIWDAWLAQIQPSAAGTPWMATVGNHEMERTDDIGEYGSYLARFRPPGGGPGPVTYAFRYANVGFVALDGNDASHEITRYNGYIGDQDGWLRSTLAGFAADPSIEFVVVGFHNCMYCTNLLHGSDGGNRSRWEPIFAEFGVDLVVNGHNHCYERTHPIGGVTYLTVGGGGQAEYPTTAHVASYVVEEGGIRVPETAEWSAVRHQEHSIAIVDVEAGRMSVTVYDNDDPRVVLDTFTLAARP